MMNVPKSMQELIGSATAADPIVDTLDEIRDAERRKQKQADQEQLSSLPSRIGAFLSKHRWAILAGLAAGAVVLMNWPSDPAKWKADFGAEPFPKKRRLPPVRGYANIGASPWMRESALRVVKAQRDQAKGLKKMSLSKRIAVSKGSRI